MSILSEIKAFLLVLIGIETAVKKVEIELESEKIEGAEKNAEQTKNTDALEVLAGS